MAYQTDYYPIEYLERRIKYYKKLEGRLTGVLKNRRIDRLSPEEQVKLVADRLKEVKELIEQFEIALIILNQYNTNNQNENENTYNA